MSLQPINSSIELVKELSRTLEKQAVPPSEEQIKDTLKIGNQYLWAVNGDVRSLLQAREAYLNVPEWAEEAYFFSDRQIAESRVEDAILKGRVDAFRWFGSTAVTAFGVQLYGVEVIEPHKMVSNNAFIPVDAVGAPLVA